MLFTTAIPLSSNQLQQVARLSFHTGALSLTLLHQNSFCPFPFHTAPGCPFVDSPFTKRTLSQPLSQAVTLGESSLLALCHS